MRMRRSIPLSLLSVKYEETARSQTSLAMHKDWNKGEPASLSLSNSNEIPLSIQPH